MSQQSIPPPRRSGYRRSNPTDLLRTATSKSHHQSLIEDLKIELTFGNSEIETYWTSLPHDNFTPTLRDHKARLKAEPRKPSPTTPWTHNASVQWFNPDDQKQGVTIVIETEYDTVSVVTDGVAPFLRPASEALKDHIQYDEGTEPWLDEHWDDQWEDGAYTVIEEMSDHGIEEPFTDASKIEGRVMFMNKRKTSFDDALLLRIDCISDERPPFEFRFKNGEMRVLSELDQSPQD